MLLDEPDLICDACFRRLDYAHATERIWGECSKCKHTLACHVVTMLSGADVRPVCRVLEFEERRKVR